jgi:hypothetical protein
METYGLIPHCEVITKSVMDLIFKYEKEIEKDKIRKEKNLDTFVVHIMDNIICDKEIKNDILLEMKFPGGFTDMEKKYNKYLKLKKVLHRFDQLVPYQFYNKKTKYHDYISNLKHNKKHDIEYPEADLIIKNIKKGPKY